MLASWQFPFTNSADSKDVSLFHQPGIKLEKNINITNLGQVGRNKSRKSETMDLISSGHIFKHMLYAMYVCIYINMYLYYIYIHIIYVGSCPAQHWFTVESPQKINRLLTTVIGFWYATIRISVDRYIYNIYI